MRLKLKGIAVLPIAFCLVTTLFAADRKIEKSELPAAVAKTAQEQSVGATVTGYSEAREGGKLEYEVHLKANGHSKDLTIAPDGKLIEIEEHVMLNDLSAEVRTALLAKAGKGKITNIESLTKNGALVAYEAQVLSGEKHTEIQVGPKGETLRHEE